MQKVAKSLLAMSIIGGLTASGVADDFQSFVGAINTNWVSRNYQGMLQVIDARLNVKTNDLPALVAKADYHTTISLNMGIVSNLVPRIENLRTNLTWSADEEAGVILDEMLDSMKNKEKCEQEGFIYGLTSNQLNQVHSEFPTNHPGSVFFSRFHAIQYSGNE